MTSGKDVIPLTVGDVYSWLSENRHFPVVWKDQNERHETKNDGNHPPEMKDTALNHWCCICGLDVVAHLRESVCKEENPVQDMDIGKPVTKSVNRCQIVPTELQITSLPVVDIRRVISGQSKQTGVHSPTAKYGIYPVKPLVAIGDPLLVTSISRIVNALSLKYFVPMDMTCDEIAGHGKMDIERKLAPFALLAVMTRLFIRLLVERGLEVVARDKKNGGGFSSKYQKTRNERITRVLTPTHILSGVVSRGGEFDNVLWCLTRLGVGVSEEVRIKLEE